MSNEVEINVVVNDSGLDPVLAMIKGKLGAWANSLPTVDLFRDFGVQMAKLADLRLSVDRLGEAIRRLPDSKTINIKTDVNNAFLRQAAASGGGGGGRGGKFAWIGNAIGGIGKGFTGVSNFAGGGIGGGAIAATLFGSVGVPAIVAALASLPFVAAAAAAGIVTAMGSGIAGLGIMSAAGTNKVKNDFKGLSKEAGDSLQQISRPWEHTLIHLINLSDRLLPRIMKPLGKDMRVMAPAVGGAFDVFLKSMTTPAVQQSLVSTGKAFALLVKSFTPQIPGIVNSFASGMNTLATSITKHPQLAHDMANILGFFLKLPGFALSGIGHLTDAADKIRRVFDSTIMPDAKRFEHNFALGFEQMGSLINRDFDIWRHGYAHLWDVTWNNTVGRVRRGISDVDSLFHRLPGEVMMSVRGLGTDLWNFGSNALHMLWNGAKSQVGNIEHFFSGFAHGIVGIFHRIWGWFSPSAVMFEGGKSLMQGLEKGIKAHAHHAISAASAVAAGVGGKATGSLQVYAQKLLNAMGWGGQWPAFNSLVMAESGWNVHATNPTSGAYGIPQALPPGKMASAGSDWMTSGFTQLRWMMGYIKSVYGNAANAWAHEQAVHWYGSGLRGGLFSRPTLIGVGERGTERVDVTPVGRSGGGGRDELVLSWEGGNGDLWEFLRKGLRARIRKVWGGNVNSALGN